MRWIAFSLGFLFALPLAAQDPIPDTTVVERYFPLGIGDVREYRAEFTWPYCEPHCFQLWRRTVVGDSAVGAFTYSVVQREEFDFYSGLPLGTATELFRVDTLEAEIRQPTTTGEQTYGGTACGLDAPFPPDGYMECGFGSAIAVTGEGYESVVVISDETYIIPVKSYWEYPSGSFRFAADIGLVLNQGCEGTCWHYELFYAHVNGIEYGTPFPVGIEQAVPGSAGLTLSAPYPNPVADHAVVEVTLPAARTLTVEVYDVLGRRVHVQELAAAAGRTPIRIDVGDLLRGQYLVRATTAAGETATTRLTRL